jgi:hypothetical protein
MRSTFCPFPRDPRVQNERRQRGLIEIERSGEIEVRWLKNSPFAMSDYGAARFAKASAT